MKRAVQLILFMLGFSLLISAASAQETRFEATLSGKNEVPGVESSAHGRATFHLSKGASSLLYTISVTGIKDPTMAHIHLAAAGKQGLPVASLYPTKAHPAKEGKFSGVLARGTITAASLIGPLKGKALGDLLARMRNGETYVNIHTKARPKGELRGQIK
jgi:CHRD domain